MGMIDRLMQARRVLVASYGPMTVTRNDRDLDVTLSTDEGTVRLCFPSSAWVPLSRIMASHAMQILQKDTLRLMHGESAAQRQLDGSAERSLAEDRDYEVMRCRMRDRLDVALSLTPASYRTPAMCAMHDTWAYEDQVDGCHCAPQGALSVVAMYAVQATVNSWAVRS